MNARWVAGGLLLLPLLYVTAVVLPPVADGESAAAAAFVVGLAVAGLSLVRSERVRAAGVGLAAVLGLTIVVAAIDRSVAVAVPLGLVAGTLLAVPWVAAAVAARSGEELGTRVVAFGVAVLFGLLALAALASLRATGGSARGPAFVARFYAMTVDQVHGIGLFVAPGPLAPPVAGFFDATFAVLVGIAAFGLLLLLAPPQTGAGVPLPVTLPDRGLAPQATELAPEYGFSSAQREVFRARTVPEAPATQWPPGLLAIAVGTLAATVFVAGAYASPYGAVLALTLGLVVTTVVLVTGAERPAPLRTTDLRTPAAPRPPAPGPESPPASADA